MHFAIQQQSLQFGRHAADGSLYVMTLIYNDVLVEIFLKLHI
jgi:hypothetical protein